MNKTQLAEAVALETGLTKIAAKKAIDASVRIAVRAFREGERLAMSGLGTFRVVQRTPRTGRNPRTGAQVKGPARKVLKFRSTTDLE